MLNYGFRVVKKRTSKNKGRLISQQNNDKHTEGYQETRQIDGIKKSSQEDQEPTNFCFEGE